MISRRTKKKARRYIKPKTFQAETVGVSNDLRKDVYYYFIEASWLKIFFILFFIYICSNLFFATLYYIQPGSISGTESQDFLDAFFFSIQTMTTIGYGTLSPNGDYANMIVTIEAAFSLLIATTMTGLVFSKISKPHAKIIFSRNMILSDFDGQKCLAFRIGNIRGNDIVEAKISVSAMIKTQTTEGQKIRKLYDLKLKRNKTPFFKMSWIIFHPIEQDSPFFEKSIDEIPLDGIAITVTGYDGTYSNTVYARYDYQPDSIVENAYYEDIISEQNGKIQINYHKFDDLKEENYF